MSSSSNDAKDNIDVSNNAPLQQTNTSPINTNVCKTIFFLLI